MISLYELEEKYKDTLENIEEWVYLRVTLGHQLKHNDKNQIFKQSDRFQKLSNNIKKLKNTFYGFKNWFRKYDYICFSDSGQRKVILNKNKDKLIDDVIDKLGRDKSLLIEIPNPKYYHENSVYTKYFSSSILIDLIVFLIKIISNYKRKTIDELDNILNDENIYFNYKNILVRFKSYYLFYKIFFKIYKPKKIFIVCSYCHLPLVKAANDLNIKVIELQHGVITKVHFGYISSIKLNNSYLASTLLSFGENEYNMKNLLIKKVIPIGSYYLDYLDKNFQIDKELLSKIKNYKYAIGVSLQDVDWEYYGMLSFIKKVAKKDRNILYILIPRRRRDKLNLSDNIILYDKLDCYNIILHCDIHATLYSSCSLEAPTLSIPNILIDMNNFANKYYKDILNKYHTKIVDNEDDFMKIILDEVNLDKKIIKEKNSKVFATNYEKRIDTFIKSIYKKV